MKGLHIIFDALISSNKRKQWSDLLLRLNYSNLQYGWNGLFFEIIVTSLEEYRVGTIKKLYMRTLHYGCKGGGSNPSYFTNHFQGYSLNHLSSPTQRVNDRVGRIVW